MLVVGGCTCGIVARYLSARSHHGHGGVHLPSRVAILGSDTGVASPMRLRDRRTGLYGTPDYVLREPHGAAGLLVALELKPLHAARGVWDSDVVQVAAYTCMLRATYGNAAATFGYLRYPFGTIRIDLTPALEGRLTATVSAIRRGRRAARVHRSHNVVARCAGCAMRSRCDERLV